MTLALTPRAVDATLRAAFAVTTHPETLLMKFLPRLLVVCLTGWLVGCGAHARPTVTTFKPAPLPLATAATALGPEVPLVVDPVATVINRAEAEFDAGQREQQRGHLVAARNH